MATAVSLAWRVRKRLFGPGIVRDALRTGHARRSLLLYTVYPFRVREGRLPHQNVGQVRELARALGELGLAADVVEHDERRRELLRGLYELVVDLHPRDPALYEGHLCPQARRIAYITGKNPEFSNAAERRRLDELERRRGVRLTPRRQAAPFPRQRLEAYDAFFYFGDRATLETYEGFRLPATYRLPNHGYDDVEPTPAGRRDPRRFLFLGGTGQVHKGLDLVLELFAAAPDLDLVVCSPVAAEPDFARAYATELRRPNIHLVGTVDVRSPRFRELQATCGTMLLPSCSEGESGSVTVALSYGLPCAVGPDCGFEDPEVEILPDCRPQTLERFVRCRAAEPAATLASRSAQSLALMHRRLRPRHYAEAVRSALRAVTGTPPGGGSR